MKNGCAMGMTLAILLFGAAALAGPPPGMVKQVMKEIGLSDPQVEQIQELTYKADRDKVDIRAELEKARMELQHLLSADKPEQATVFGQLDKIGALELRLKKNRIGLMLQIRGLMTREQWEKLEAVREHHQAERRARWRGRGAEGPGVPEPPTPPPPPGP